MKTMKKASSSKSMTKAKPKAKMGMVTKKTPMVKKGVGMKKGEMGMEVESSSKPKPKRRGFGKGAVPGFKVKPPPKGKKCTSKGCN